MDISRIEVLFLGGVSSRCPKYCGDEPMELVDARAFRVASNSILASSWSPDPKQDPVRKLAGAAWSAYALAETHDGTLGEDDARGEGKVSRRYERPLRYVWIATNRAEGVSPC